MVFWVGCAVETVSPDSTLPAYAIFASITPGPTFIGDVTLHSSGGGPCSSWLPSMALEEVESMLLRLDGLLDAGAQLVSWDGVRFWSFFNQYNLSDTAKAQLNRIVVSHYDLRRAFFFGLSGDAEAEDSGLEPPPTAGFPFSGWLSGVRSEQWAAVQHSLETLVSVSKMWHGIDAAYFEDGRSVSVRALCSERHVRATFGHSGPVARRLSASLQDDITAFV